MPTYAPPPRTIHTGAPGRLDPGDMEVGVASSGFIVPSGLAGTNIGYAVNSRLTVEGGLDANYARQGGWTMGWAGVRTPRRFHLRRKLSLAVDGAAGLGLGVGGCASGDDVECNADRRDWWERPAGGGYLDAGAAVRWGPMSLYSRGRMQVARSLGTPTTHWASVLFGLHGHILDRADLWGGMALAQYSNREHTTSGWIAEVGLSFRFDPVFGWR